MLFVAVVICYVMQWLGSGASIIQMRLRWRLRLSNWIIGLEDSVTHLWLIDNQISVDDRKVLMIVVIYSNNDRLYLASFKG